MIIDDEVIANKRKLQKVNDPGASQLSQLDVYIKANV